MPSAQESGGDPWIFGQVSAATMWDWINSKYFTRRFYTLALEKAGMSEAGIGYFMHRADKDGLDKTDLRRIRRYIRSCVGLAA